MDDTTSLSPAARSKRSRRCDVFRQNTDTSSLNRELLLPKVKERDRSNCVFHDNISEQSVTSSSNLSLVPTSNGKGNEEHVEPSQRLEPWLSHSHPFGTATAAGRTELGPREDDKMRRAPLHRTGVREDAGYAAGRALLSCSFHPLPIMDRNLHNPSSACGTNASLAEEKLSCFAVNWPPSRPRSSTRNDRRRMLSAQSQGVD
ncbi:hypothetical protein C8J57DRAFT_1240347 [Mycena rebaudengoi]|nr:hypothetical protein C8J57DRAFT_1476290 [Mycena rebaudengoi]KAJ7248420.1 hypothetical protein C8J57DRAFT_1240347 [Mycena rebaudengoi]